MDVSTVYWFSVQNYLLFVLIFFSVLTSYLFRSGTDLISLLIFLLGRPLFNTIQKSQGSILSDRIGMKSGTLVPQVNTKNMRQADTWCALNRRQHFSASWPSSWKYGVKSKIRLRQWMCIYLRNIAAKFHPGLIGNDRALGFFEDSHPTKRTTTRWEQDQCSDMRSVSDPKTESSSSSSISRVCTTPENPGNLLEFNWSSWKFFCKMSKIDRIGFQS